MRNLSVINPSFKRLRLDCKNRLFLHDRLLRLHTAIVQHEPPSMFCLGTSHSLPPGQTGCKHYYCEAQEPFWVSPLTHLKRQQYHQVWPRLEKQINESTSCVHKLYTVKKKPPQLLPKYAEHTGMLYGALSERTKKAQSDSFPQRYHIRTSLVGKFLIYAVIFLRFGTGKPLISRCHWILRRTPLNSLFFPIGPRPTGRQQIIATRSGSEGSILSVDR